MIEVERIKEIISKAENVLIFAGAGMSNDSGLPVFRGNEGLWNEYPFLKRLNLNFKTIADPSSFQKHPIEANKFYIHRMDLYKRTNPHVGFNYLLDLVKKLNENYFVITSNVDGHFQKAGFNPDKIYEVHGNINNWQCIDYKCSRINKNKKFDDFVENNGVIYCPFCGKLARPNLLMFFDFSWEDSIYSNQKNKYLEFFYKENFRKTAIFEIGCGKDIPTIRNLGIEAALSIKTNIIRINPEKEEDFDPLYISLKSKALEGLKMIFDKD